jgi:ATP-dependent RNA helicase SUPV3L1/SUV3
MIRGVDARAGFEATPDMLSITGCTLEQFADLMQGLGYAAERGERPKPQRAAALPADGTAAVAASPDPVPAGELPTDTTTALETAPASGPDNADQPENVAAESVPVTAAEQEAAPAAPDASHATLTSEPAAPDGETTTEESGQAAETEVFYTFRLQPRRQSRPPRRDGNAGNRGRRNAPSQSDTASGREAQTTPETQGKRDGDGTPKPKSGARPPRHDKPGRKAGPRQDGKPGRGPRPPRDDNPRVFSAAPKDDKRQADPDNPFAVLKQLKDRM